MRIENEIKLDYKDVLIRPKRSTLKSRKDVSLRRTYQFRNSGQSWSGIPIIAANMDGVGTFEMTEALSSHELFTCLNKHYSPEDWHANHDLVDLDYTALSVGSDWRTFLETSRRIILKHDLKWLCVDIANGYSEHFTDFIKRVRELHPKINIIAGNVVTADMTQELILAGADVVKVGIGPGSVCTTRIQTGVGYPQLSAVIECADAAHGLGGHIVADGGCTCPGDVAKAFAAGADFVMLGGMLAGHDEGGGEVIQKMYKTNQYSFQDFDLAPIKPKYVMEQFVQFYGMSSDTAMNKHAGGVANYRSSEGRTVEVPYRGSVVETVKNILGGLRSTCTYVGAPTLKQLSKCTTFVRCTQQYNNIFSK